MPAKNKIKKEIKRIKTWLHSVDALSRPAGGGACQERRSSRWWSSWRRSCRIHSVLRGKVGGGGSPSRPVPPPIHVSLICFPVSAASPLTSPSRVRGRRVAVGGSGAPRLTVMMMMMMMLSSMSATSDHPLISYPLARQHQNKATITNSFTLWGGFRLPATAWLPWED